MENSSVPTFKCKFCKKLINTAQGLKSHITRLHKGISDVVLPDDAVPSSSSTTPDDARPISSQASPDFDSLSLARELAYDKKHLKIVRRIPKGARGSAADALADVISSILTENTTETWTSLFRFSASCLQIPKSDSKLSLATIIKRNIAIFRSNGFVRHQTRHDTMNHAPARSAQVHDVSFSPKLVESKLAEGDVIGAVRSLCTEESFAPNNHETLEKLLLKHPAHDASSDNIPVQSQEVPSFPISEQKLKRALSSFPVGSAGGPDGLRPQHLKDLVSHSAGASGVRLVTALTNLCALMLNGRVPREICPVLYGASLFAFKKKDGGIRPIAVGNTIRRLAAKIGSSHVMSKLGETFQPIQLGFGTRGGAEAAAHAARRFINFPHSENTVFLKIDFRNAFNSINRNCMLKAVSDFMPELFPFLSQCYNEPSHLMYNESHISSQTGIQQGDPLGSAIFCSVVHPLAASLKSKLNIWYLDDAALGGPAHMVLNDMKNIIHESSSLGLDLNFEKCEIFDLSTEANLSCENSCVFSQVSSSIKYPERCDWVLLGAPLTDVAIPKVLATKTHALKVIKSRLMQVKSHSAFFILKNVLAIPKLMYLLRCSPTWRSETSLSEFDCVLRATLESTCNSEISDNSWLQSSLPISDGGLGIRHASDISLPAFLSSVCSTSSLTNKILQHSAMETADIEYLEGTTFWTNLTNTPASVVENQCSQKAWELIKSNQLKTDLHERANSLQDKARLLGVASKASGAFLNALPSPSLGTFLENNAFRIAIALRLGLQICQPYQCICGTQMDTAGIHGLSCKKTPGRLSRHSMVNDVLKRGLASAGFPVVLEPANLSNQDGRRRPDGTTLIPWTEGKFLTWDFTCVNSQATSYVSSTACAPLQAATTAEAKKRMKYSYLDQTHLFMPIAVECLGSFGQDSLRLVKEIGNKISDTTGESRAREYFLQRLSVAVQKGNATSIMATAPEGDSLDSYLCIL